MNCQRLLDTNHFHIEFDIDDDISKLMNDIDLLVEYIVKRLGNDK